MKKQAGANPRQPPSFSTPPSPRAIYNQPLQGHCFGERKGREPVAFRAGVDLRKYSCKLSPPLTPCCLFWEGRLSCSVRLQPGLRKLGQPPCPSAGTGSLYAVICLPAVKTSCKVSHYLRRLTREAGPDRGAHRCPQSRRGPQTSPPGGPHAGPGPPVCGAAQRPAPERCRRARGGPAPRPMAGSPAPREGSLSTNCRFLSSASGGSRDMPSPRPRKQVGRRRGRLAGTPLRKPTVELGAPQQSGAPAPSAGSRANRASSAPGLDRDWLPGRARVSQGSTGTPTTIRPAPQARERPGARACLTAVTEPKKKTGDESRVPEASG